MRILSVYVLANDERIWIITEAVGHDALGAGGILISLPLDDEIYPASHQPLVKIAREIKDREVHARPGSQ
jgi:hypothetical protein